MLLGRPPNDIRVPRPRTSTDSETKVGRSDGARPTLGARLQRSTLRSLFNEKLTKPRNLRGRQASNAMNRLLQALSFSIPVRHKRMMRNPAGVSPKFLLIEQKSIKRLCSVYSRCVEQ